MIILFKTCITNFQEVGSQSEKLQAKVIFEINGQEYFCILNQPDGGINEFEDSPIEVSQPTPSIKLNYGEFRDSVEEYYRMCVGSNGRGINFSGSTNVTISNFVMDMPFQMTISEVDDINKS
jgi:hypothetical protein